MQPEDNSSFLIPLEDAFACAGHELYLVGGFVRNRLLGLPASDLDLCGTASPDEAIVLCHASGYKAVLRSCELGTVDIVLGDQKAEYTPFRIESYAKGGSHRPVHVLFTRDILLDARRRDFTVNALYQRIRSGEIVDPLLGMQDLIQKRLRACGSTASDTLSDDGLRILRMVRFCAELGFSPDDDLLSASRAFAKNLTALSPSRIFLEWQRICLCDLKYPSFASGVDKPYAAMDILHRCGALFVLMPSLYHCMDIPQDPRYHRHDVFFHSLHCFAAVKADVSVRTAALLHDIGKAPSFTEQRNMHAHVKEGLLIADPILSVLGIPNVQRAEILHLIERHMFDLNGRANADTVRIRFANWGFCFSRKLIDLRRGDIIGSCVDSNDKTAARWEGILQAMMDQGAFDDPRLLAINGDDIAAACRIRPGKRIGKIKQILFDRCAVCPAMNKRDVLIHEAIRVNRQLPVDENSMP